MPLRVTTSLIVLLSLLISGAAFAHEKGDEALPPPPVRMRVIAPSAQGPWLLRIDNEGDEHIRIAADVRLLRFEVRVPSDKPIRNTHAHGWTKRAATCDGPKAFGMGRHFPQDRELTLEPGHSYTQEFDPRLICFGKNADLLVPGAKVKPSMGWKRRPRWSRKMEAAPFVADSAKRPRKYRPLKRIEGPSMVLSHAPSVVYGSNTRGRSNPDDADEDRDKKAELPHGVGEGEGLGDGAGRGTSGGVDEPRPDRARSAEEASEHRPVRHQARKRPKRDELGARMTLTASHYADARRPTDISLSVEAHNTGERPVFVALRSRMLSFRVEGPDGVFKCRRLSRRHHVPRDLYRSLQHGKHVHMNVMLSEVCPPGAFDRAGLYIATPRLHADADGGEYGLIALTGVVTTRDPGKPSGKHIKADDATLIRMKRSHNGRRFYRRPPAQLPTRVLPQ